MASNQSLSSCTYPLQILPFCSEEALETLETNLATLPSVTNMLNSGMSANDITEKCVLQTWNRIILRITVTNEVPCALSLCLLSGS